MSSKYWQSVTLIHNSRPAQFPSGHCNFLSCLIMRCDPLFLWMDDHTVLLGSLSLSVLTGLVLTPSGWISPLPFEHRVLTTCILELAIGSYSFLFEWTAFQPVVFDMNFGFPNSHDVLRSLYRHLVTAFPRTSGQHQSNLVNATFCLV